MTIYQQFIASPVGELAIQATGQGLCYVGFDRTRFESNPCATNEHTEAGAQQLSEYFSGQRQHFNLSLDVHGTAFQLRVWHALNAVEFGQTNSYLGIAQAIDNPKAVRAVGAANGRNPISIIVPCHRVIGSNGSLTGYAGGMERKKWLLDFERDILTR